MLVKRPGKRRNCLPFRTCLLFMQVPGAEPRGSRLLLGVCARAVLWAWALLCALCLGPALGLGPAVCLAGLCLCPLHTPTALGKHFLSRRRVDIPPEQWIPCFKVFQANIPLHCLPSSITSPGNWRAHLWGP